MISMKIKLGDGERVHRRPCTKIRTKVYILQENFSMTKKCAVKGVVPYSGKTLVIVLK